LKATIGQKPEDPVPIKDKKAREELRATYWDVVDGGMKNLEALWRWIATTTTPWHT